MAAASIRRAPRSVANMLASGAHFGGLLVANCSVTVPGMEATVELQCSEVLVERRETLGTDAWEQLHWKTNSFPILLLPRKGS